MMKLKSNGLMAWPVIFLLSFAAACGPTNGSTFYYVEGDDTNGSSDAGSDTGSTSGTNDTNDTNDTGNTDDTDTGNTDDTDTGNADTGNTDDVDTTDTTGTIPIIESTIPLDSATFVSINGNIEATFSEPMDPASFTSATFIVTSGIPPVEISGGLSYSGLTAVFSPDVPLADGTLFTVTITTDVASTEGVFLASDYVWTFTTGTVIVPTIPTVVSHVPLNGASAVSVNGNITATFSEPMDPLTFTPAAFTVTFGSAPIVQVAGTLTYNGLTAVFTPSAPLPGDTFFTATITTAACSAAGVCLDANYVWVFTTAHVNPAQLPVDLGTAINYAVLTKSGISSVPASVITGNLGVSPAAASSITGFSLIIDSTNTFSTSTQVIGMVFGADYATPTPTNLTTAINNMQTAFTDAAGRAADVTELGAGNIGGMTLDPGVYKWGSGLLIPTNVTLSGNANDIWIFQIAQNLSLSNGAQVFLTGGAQPKNVFWQVSGAIQLGTTSHIEGIVMSQTAIVMRTGASVIGRLFAQTAVTIDAGTVTQPAP